VTEAIQVNNPLHGITLEMILSQLVDRYGWERLGIAIDIRCFKHDPSIKSSLQFLRRTPWARRKVEYLYLRHKRRALGSPGKRSKAKSAREITQGGGGDDVPNHTAQKGSHEHTG
jgi:uncharacterized protein (DUF2132 family)